MLRHRDYRNVLDVVHDAHEAGHGLLGQATLTAIERLVGADYASVNVIDHGERRVLDTVVPAERNLAERPVFRRTFASHPAFEAWQRGAVGPLSVLSLSDLGTARALRGHPLYAECYRPLGIADQLLSILHLGPARSVVLACNRSRRGVGRRDREVAGLLAPHLAQVLRRQREHRRLAAALRAATRHDTLLTSATGRLGELTPREREVAVSVAGGRSDRQVALLLGVAERTVNKHLENVYRKLGVPGRAGLTALLHRGPAR